MRITDEMVAAAIMQLGFTTADSVRIRAALEAALSASDAEPVASIVPPHCSGTAFVFEPGVLHVNKDGSGYIAIDEDDFVLEDDRCEGPDNAE